MNIRSLLDNILKIHGVVKFFVAFFRCTSMLFISILLIILGVSVTVVCGWSDCLAAG